MKFYPSYKLRDILEMPAVSFFALLNEGYRQHNEMLHMLATIAILVIAEPESRKTFMKQLEWASKDASDILKPSDNASSSEEIKQFFGKKV